MKIITTIISILVLNALPFGTKAQVVSGDVFLQGKYLEAGIAPNGTLGSANAAPAAYHAKSSIYPGLIGIVTDPGKDGWSTGTPAQMGDYIMPSVPIESWAVQFDDSLFLTDRSYGASVLPVGMSGSNSGYKIADNRLISAWNGKLSKMNIQQVTSIDVNKKYIRFDIELVNSSTQTLKKIYYARHTDPNNEVEESVSPAGYATHMSIDHQLPDPKQKVSVSATGDKYRSVISLGTRDCRAKAYFFNTSSGLRSVGKLDLLYKGTGYASSFHYNKGDTAFSDVGMGIVFNLDSLLPGEVKTLSYVYSLDSADIDLDLAASSSAVWLRGGSATIMNNDTIYACDSDLIPISISSVGSANWIWKPSPLLSTVTGITNTILATGTHTFTAYRNDTSACNGKDTLNITVVGRVPVKPVITKTGSVLTVSPAGIYLFYQWIRNGIDIPGATASTYMPHDSACYAISVMDTNFCPVTSDVFCIDKLAITETELYKDFIVYPNPTTGKLYIQTQADINLMIKDISGRILMKVEQQKEINISSFAPGLYFLNIYTKNGALKEVHKIVKEK